MPSRPPPIPRPDARRLAHLEKEAQWWLWPGRVPMGALTLIAGDPGVGKSLVAIDIAARVTAGKGWPDGAKYSGVPGDVVYVGGEDDLCATVRPRLEAAGADVERVYSLEGVLEEDSDQTLPFHLRRHHRSLRLLIQNLETPALVLIDPLWSHLPSCGSAAEVGAAVADINRTAQEYRIAFLAVTHLNKQATARAIYRSAGNMALIASTRCAHLVATDERWRGRAMGQPSAVALRAGEHASGERRLFLPIKNNLCEPIEGLAFFVGKSGIHWDTGGGVNADADAALRSALTPRERLAAEVAEAASFVSDLLKSGGVPAADVFAAAAARGLSRARLRRAAHHLAVRFDKEGERGRWMWTLPGDHAKIVEVSGGERTP